MSAREVSKSERSTTTNPTAGPDTAASAGTRPRACTAYAPIRLQPKRPASARHLARMSTLREVIHENVREGELYEKLDRNWVRCFACGHSISDQDMDRSRTRRRRVQRSPTQQAVSKAFRAALRGHRRKHSFGLPGLGKHKSGVPFPLPSMRALTG